MSLDVWAQDVAHLGMYIDLHGKTPITASDHAALVEAERTRMAPVQELAEEMADRFDGWTAADVERGDEGEEYVSEAAWTRVCRESEKQLRALVADGTLRGRRPRSGVEIEVGSYCDWLGETPFVAPEWGPPYEIHPDAEADAVMREQRWLEQVREILQSTPRARIARRRTGRRQRHRAARGWQGTRSVERRFRHTGQTESLGPRLTFAAHCRTRGFEFDPTQRRSRRFVRRGAGQSHSGRASARPTEAEREARIDAIPGLRARIAAHQVISDVVANGHALDERFAPGAVPNRTQGLDARDKALVRSISTVAMRRLGAIRRALARLLDRGLPRNAGQFEWIAIAALAQILFLDTPDHAAVDLAVRAAKADPKTASLAYHYPDENPTSLVVQLPEPIESGGQVRLRLDFSYKLAPKKGRWGQWDGVTVLAQGLPTVAVYDMCAPDDELLSDAFDRFRTRHGILGQLAVTITANHLLRRLPATIDPFSIIGKIAHAAKTAAT